jgi:hypothetical protein
MEKKKKKEEEEDKEEEKKNKEEEDVEEEKPTDLMLTRENEDWGCWGTQSWREYSDLTEGK